MASPHAHKTSLYLNIRHKPDPRIERLARVTYGTYHNTAAYLRMVQELSSMFIRTQIQNKHMRHEYLQYKMFHGMRRVSEKK